MALTVTPRRRYGLPVKTTLVIDDRVMARLKEEAARTGHTMSDLVEDALRRMLESKPERTKLRPLPSFNSGGSYVDISDRKALYHAIEGR